MWVARVGARLRFSVGRTVFELSGASVVLVLAVLLVAREANAQSAPSVGPPEPAATAIEPWLDRTQEQLYDAIWRSAMRIDRWFGSEQGEAVYRRASGSIAPALLWDQFHRFQSLLRFRADVPLPQLNDRIAGFIGRVNPDEYVTERAEESGAFPRQSALPGEEQTLLGLSYRERPRQGGHFSAGAGVRVSLPLDPYVKGSFMYERGVAQSGIFTVRETLFWQNSERLGLTSRLDVGRVLQERWLLQWTGSATVSQKSEGVRGYTSLTALRAFVLRRAFALAVGLDGDSKALVPLHEYGARVAYRQSVKRDWLVLEVRTSLLWPKDDPVQPRKPSWGVGMGLEVVFGTHTFLARPVTF
jgi:hypothetical protein